MSDVNDIISSLKKLINDHEESKPSERKREYELRFWNHTTEGMFPRDNTRPIGCQRRYSSTLDCARDDVIDIVKRWHNVELYDCETKQVVIYYKEEKI